MHINVKIPKEFLKQAFSECLEEYGRTKLPSPHQPETRYIYSLKGLAEFLNCSTTTAQKIKNSGRIRFRQIGRKCVFNTAEILEDIANNRSRKCKC